MDFQSQRNRVATAASTGACSYVCFSSASTPDPEIFRCEERARQWCVPSVMGPYAVLILLLAISIAMDIRTAIPRHNWARLKFLLDG
jgi:hypothetical protein